MMDRIKRYRYLYMLPLLLLGMLQACNNGSQEKVIPIDTMKYITWDMLKADEWFSRLSLKDSMAAARKADVNMYEAVFKVHKVSSERFFNSYRYYEAHPIEYKALLDSVNALIDRYREQKE